MKSINILLVSVALFCVGCTTSSTDFSSSAIEGEVVVGRFGGTEMACGFNEDAEIGSRAPCNSGEVAIGISTLDKGTVWIVDARCGADEILIRTEAGVDVEYETTKCTNGLKPGNRVRVDGQIELREDQWLNGQQQDEWWMSLEKFELF